MNSQRRAALSTSTIVITLAVFLSLVVLVVLTSLPERDSGVKAQLFAPLEGDPPDPGNFSRASGPITLRFPQDHGPHPDYQTEWWYYTGNLDGPDGRRFGYMLTFFRRALAPEEELPGRESQWATGQVYLGHFALSDIDGRSFQAFERFARGAAGIAGAQAVPYRVWLEDWSVEEIARDRYRLRARQGGLGIDLTLADLKGPILHGEDGYSQKGPQVGNASYYYSLTRLETGGTVTLDGQEYPVTGWSWMDHEFSTSALSEGQTGWDWYSIQLDDGSELMVYQIRRADGSVDPFSSGTFVDPDGDGYTLNLDDFEIETGSTWRSPHSGGEYPSGWLVNIPALQMRLEIAPLQADQEMNLSFTYWEGAVEISGTRGGTAVRGRGYVEMTGYSGSMVGQF